MHTSLCAGPAPAARRPGPLKVSVAGRPRPEHERLGRTGDLILRQVRPPYTRIRGGACDVVLLYVTEGDQDQGQDPDLVPRLCAWSPPVLPAAAAHRTGSALRHGVVSCLVDGDYDDVTLRGALRGTAAGLTVLSPAAARALSGALGHPPANRLADAPGAPRFRPSLSPRQGQLMDLAAGGLTVAEIGDRMALAVKTVRNYLSAIYCKLGVSSRTEAVLLWLDAGPRPTTPHGNLTSVTARAPAPASA